MMVVMTLSGLKVKSVVLLLVLEKKKERLVVVVVDKMKVMPFVGDHVQLKEKGKTTRRK